MGSKQVKNREGKVLMRHKVTKGTAWFDERTLPHHRKAGWVLASDNDDQPPPAGDTGTPAGGSDNSEGTNA